MYSIYLTALIVRAYEWRRPFGVSGAGLLDGRARPPENGCQHPALYVGAYATSDGRIIGKNVRSPSRPPAGTTTPATRSMPGAISTRDISSHTLRSFFPLRNRHHLRNLVPIPFRVGESARHRRVEPHVRADKILRNAVAPSVHQAQVEPRVRMPALRGLAIPNRRFLVVLGNAVATFVHQPQIELRDRKPLLRGPAKPCRRSSSSRERPCPERTSDPGRTARSHAPFRGLEIPRRLFVVAGNALASSVHPTQIELRDRALPAPCETMSPPFVVAGNALALSVHYAQVDLGVASALRGLAEPRRRPSSSRGTPLPRTSNPG